jgi:hypothetical protein
MKRSNLAAVFLVSLVVVLVAIQAVGCTSARSTGQPIVQPAATREAVPEGNSETSEAATVRPAVTSRPESTPSTAPLPDAAESASAETVPVQPAIAGINAAGDGVVLGWAVLAEKDDYDDVDMTNLPVNHIGITQMRQALVDSGWDPDQIRDLREFDRHSLEEGLDWLAEHADQDDIVIVYVAAHGQYLRDTLNWGGFLPPEWAQIPSHRRLLVIDSCQAANYTSAVSADTAPYLTIASVAGDEYGWSGLEEEGLPIIGGVFTHYFAAAFGNPGADADGDGLVSAQEAAMMAEDQQRAYMHDVVFAVPEFLEMYHGAGAFPDQDPAFPHVVVDDALGEPLFLTLDAYH